MTELESSAQIQQTLYVSRLLILVPYTILVYEYFLTLEREVSRFWGTRPTWATFFFYLNRYSSLFGTPVVLFQYYSTTTDPKKMLMSVRCKALRAYHQYFALISQVLVAVMLIMRTFALYERNKTVLAFMVLVTLGAIVFAVSLLSTGTDVSTLSAQIAAFGCPIGTPHAKSLRLAAAWSGMLIFDVTIFALTVFKAVKLNTRRGSLLTILIRDGASKILSFPYAYLELGLAHQPFISGGATTITNVVSSVAISRLMLNLRDPAIRLPQGNNYTTRRTTEGLAISTVSPYTTEYTMDTEWTNTTED
ncbi:hypothetical protein DFH07DRAFT_999438 [Mycena maculata]|uniref:DUF6533 domain-containing protein n=1 Tax=Mycena maculata TaxID=230809 RepID=A0AAD7JT94_9AGAR|nr:hypothetical protein DFH07DRAFT_999438 [Mycena maculata]